MTRTQISLEAVYTTPPISQHFHPKHKDSVMVWLSANLDSDLMPQKSKLLNPANKVFFFQHVTDSIYM